ncbi:MAG: response regulator [Cyanobacteria bacterium J06634_6]
MINKQILIIDDESDIQTIARLGLTMMGGWEVLSATSGKEGLQHARSQAKDRALDAILLDVMMPDMDGIATLKALRADALTQDIPIVFLTAKSRAANRKQLYALGAQGVIHKPFDPTTLASQISGFLGWDS